MSQLQKGIAFHLDEKAGQNGQMASQNMKQSIVKFQSAKKKPTSYLQNALAISPEMDAFGRTLKKQSTRDVEKFKLQCSTFRTFPSRSKHLLLRRNLYCLLNLYFRTPFQLEVPRRKVQPLEMEVSISNDPSARSLFIVDSGAIRKEEVRTPPQQFNIGHEDKGRGTQSYESWTRKWKRDTRSNRGFGRSRGRFQEQGRAFDMTGFYSDLKCEPYHAFSPPPLLKILYWNCWGMGQQEKCSALNGLVKLNRPQYLFLMETKVQQDATKEVFFKIGFL